MLQRLPALLPAALFAAGLGLAACDDGPAEQAGEQVDETIEDTGRAVEDATD